MLIRVADHVEKDRQSQSRRLQDTGIEKETGNYVTIQVRVRFLAPQL